MEACKSPNEEARLAALYRYNILDTPAASDYDDITRLISRICEAPIAVVNLIDRDRQFFLSEIGLGVRETPLDISICAHALLQPDVFIVPDTQKDIRFVDNPLVTGDPHLRFYAGALLQTTEGLPLGTLCVLDYRPRTLDDSQIDALRTLARQVMAQIELRYAYQREHRIAETLQLALLAKPREGLVHGLDVKTIYTPAWDEAQVGGDFYDVLPLPHGRVGLVVGDVSGKGLVAAAHTARAKFTLRVYLAEGLSPAEALSRLNDHLVESPEAQHNAGLTFIALGVAIIEPQTGHLTIAVAGIEPPLIRRAGGNVVDVIEGNCLPLGIDSPTEYSDQSFQLETGDLLLLATDGITEARQDRLLFGYDRLVETVLAAPETDTLETIGASILETARDFARGSLRDDVCILLARRDL